MEVSGREKQFHCLIPVGSVSRGAEAERDPGDLILLDLRGQKITTWVSEQTIREG